MYAYISTPLTNSAFALDKAPPYTHNRILSFSLISLSFILLHPFVSSHTLFSVISSTSYPILKLNYIGKLSKCQSSNIHILTAFCIVRISSDNIIFYDLLQCRKVAATEHLQLCILPATTSAKTCLV